MEWSPRRVAFSYRRPDDLREYERLFRCPLVFDSQDSQLVFSRSLWDTEIPGSDPQLHRVLDEHAHQQLVEHPSPGDITVTIRRLISAELADGAPKLEGMARQLGMSGRSLQRRLGERGLTYGNLLDQVRALHAEAHLRDPDLALSEVSYLLGFLEQSSFSRAFRRWKGISPAQYRSSFVKTRTVAGTATDIKS